MPTSSAPAPFPVVDALGTWFDGGGVYTAWREGDTLTFTTASYTDPTPYSVDTYPLTRTPQHDPWAQWDEYMLTDRIGECPDIDPDTYAFVVLIDGHAYGAN